LPYSGSQAEAKSISKHRSYRFKMEHLYLLLLWQRWSRKFVRGRYCRADWLWREFLERLLNGTFSQSDIRNGLFTVSFGPEGWKLNNYNRKLDCKDGAEVSTSTYTQVQEEVLLYAHRFLYK